MTRAAKPKAEPALPRFAPWPREWNGGPSAPHGEPRVSVDFDLDTRADSNAKGGAGKARWAKNARVEEAREAIERALTFPDDRLVKLAARGPWCVRLTRFSSSAKLLDVGNLWSALKAVEDFVAFVLGTDDGSPSFGVLVAQERRKGPLGVRIEVWGPEALPLAGVA